MNQDSLRMIKILSRKIFFASSLILFAAIPPAIFAQTNSSTEDLQARLSRARALAAAHSLSSAVNELDGIRKEAKEDSLRDVASVMLMSIFLEEADYTRAESLLEETYKLRATQKEGSIQCYFALAGQAITGARAHLDRYRSYGINLADQQLPQESIGDLDRLRSLLERVAAQAKEINVENEKSTDANALLEDVARLRATLSRDTEERAKWQQEFDGARQRLAASETRIETVSTKGNRSGNSPQSSPASGSQLSSHVTNTTTTQANAKSKPSSTAPDKSIASTPQGEAVKNQAGNDSKKESGPVDVGSLFTKATERRSPNYPQIAKSAGIVGVVKVYVVVDENGAVAAVQSTDGPVLLRKAAEDAARRWKFNPTVVDGQPVRISGYINFNFTN
ncbi:MAG: energy transducer TonB [Pyrinomonadaceae bacterium]